MRFEANIDMRPLYSGGILDVTRILKSAGYVGVIAPVYPVKMYTDYLLTYFNDEQVARIDSLCKRCETSCSVLCHDYRDYLKLACHDATLGRDCDDICYWLTQQYMEFE